MGYATQSKRAGNIYNCKYGIMAVSVQIGKEGVK